MPIGNEALNVALTFDDGHTEHYDIARTLHRRKIRATFFSDYGIERMEKETPAYATAKPNQENARNES
jgi:hypothetical protein